MSTHEAGYTNSANIELYGSCDMARMAATLRTLAGERVLEATERDPKYSDHDHMKAGISVGQLNIIDGVIDYQPPQPMVE